MWILDWAILLFLVLAVPFGLRMLPTKYMRKDRQTLAMLYCSGWFMSFAMFELISIPFILLQKSFRDLVLVYTISIVGMLGISIWKGNTVLAQCIGRKSNLKELSPMARLGWGIAVLCIMAQVCAAIFLEYYDGDDSYYMAQATAAYTYDTMYLRDSYTGYVFGLDIRHALSPVPIYLAWLSQLSGIHVTIIAHSVIAPVWIFFMYCMFCLVADRLLEKNRNYKSLFMMLISIWLCLGNVSIYTVETFSLTRIWQGKGLMAGIILPMLILCLLYLAEEEVDKGVWLLLEICIISACFATTTSLLLVPTLMGMSSLILAFRKKSVVWIGKMLLCCIPCLVVAVLYLVCG